MILIANVFLTETSYGIISDFAKASVISRSLATYSFNLSFSSLVRLSLSFLVNLFVMCLKIILWF